MNRIATTLSLTALLLLVIAGPAAAGMLACPPSPPPGSTLECGVSNSEPEETLAWEASFADGTEEAGELTTDEEGAGGLAVDIPDDPELAGTEFTIELETGASYTGMVGAPEDAAEDDADVEAQADEAPEAEDETEDADAEADDAEAEADQEQVSERPDEDSEVALGAGGTAGAPALALLVAVLGAVLLLGGATVLVRGAAARR